MERQLQREHVLLGAAPRDPFASPDPSVGLSRRRSDVEFDDVFGGPPTRFAIYSRRHSLEESRDANSPRVSGGSEQEEALQSRRPWNSLGEKPVFGETFSPSSRRRGLGDDFFNDIFRGSDSACSTPRMLDRDAFSSTPGSRVLSPARPLPPRPDSFSSTPGSRVLSPARSFPPRNEPLTGTSSLQSPLSLPQKMTEVLDYPTFGSSRDLGINENEDSVLGAVTSMASIPEVVSGNQDDWKTDPHTSFYQSDLSFRYSLDEEIIQEANHSAAANIEARGRENSTNSKDNSRNNQFHFSIYKWASRGVMLVLPSNLKERDKTKGRLSELPVPFLQGVDLPPNNKNMPAREKVFPSDLVKDGKSLLSEVYTENQDSEDFTKPMERTSPSKLQPVPSPADVTKKQGSSEDVKQVKERENVLGNDIFLRSADNLVEIKRQTIKKTVSDLSDAQDVSISLEGKTQPGRVKGKVKEFIKIFNQDISCKPMNRRQSPRVQDLGNYKVEDHANVYRIKMEEILADEKLDFDLSPDDKKTPEFPQEKNEASAPSFESTIENVEVVYADIEEPHYEVEECVVESLLEEYNELPQTDKSVEEFQNPDVKIREWSAGKEGNIRSLLSTLQYVLWPGSGWKPVPLVDVIEGASVKRAYQRALLCLHPDKLQQRGAPAHQKYIAEKVFDILQDAWSEFNSVGNLL